MKRECRIIIPKSTESETKIRVFELKVCATAGGFTRYDGHGGWIDGDGLVICEDIHIYDIAVDNDSDAEQDLKEIAKSAIQTFKQDCVYFRNCDGAVELLTG